MKIALFDAQYLLRRIIARKELENLSYNGIRTGGIYGFITSLKSNLKTINADFVVCCWDGGRSERRKKLFHHYKEKSTTGLDEIKLQEHINFMEYFSTQQKLCQYFLSIVGIPSIHLKMEADDIIYYLSKELSLYSEIIIVSDDHDFLQLVSPNIKVYRTMLGLTVDVNNFVEAVKVPSPDHYVLLDACCGDGRETIPIAGVGGGTAIKHIKDLEIPTLDALYNKLLNDKKLNARSKKLLDNFDIIRTNYELVKLSYEEFSNEDKSIINSLIFDLPDTFDEELILRFLQQLGMDSMIKHFDSFVLPFKLLLSSSNLIIKLRESQV